MDDQDLPDAQGMSISEPHRGLVMTLVRLTSDRYSAPIGSLGAVEDHVGQIWVEDRMVNAVEVAWVGDEATGGGSSVPVLETDLELVGYLNVALEKAHDQTSDVPRFITVQEEDPL